MASERLDAGTGCRFSPTQRIGGRRQSARAPELTFGEDRAKYISLKLPQVDLASMTQYILFNDEELLKL
jgi:hypothetical protein